jgi:hypothetical protein
VTFEITPQVHAADDATILENLDTLPLLAREIRRLTGPLPVDIACALRPRLAPYRRQPVPDADGDRIDSRLHTPIGAAWIVGVLADLASSGAERLTMLEATGPAGWIPEHALSSEPSGLTQVLAAVPRRGRVLPVRCDPGVACLAVGEEPRCVVVAANLSGRPLEASFLLSGRSVEQVTVLDDTGVRRDASPIRAGGQSAVNTSSVNIALMPLAVVIIDATLT